MGSGTWKQANVSMRDRTAGEAYISGRWSLTVPRADHRILRQMCFVARVFQALETNAHRERVLLSLWRMSMMASVNSWGRARATIALVVFTFSTQYITSTLHHTHDDKVPGQRVAHVEARWWWFQTKDSRCTCRCCRARAALLFSALLAVKRPPLGFHTFRPSCTLDNAIYDHNEVSPLPSFSAALVPLSFPAPPQPSQPCCLQS